MANFKLTQTGEQIQADLNLLDSNSATSGQVLTANGTGGANWQNASGGGGSGGGTQLFKHQITDTIEIISTRSTAYSSITDIFDDNGIITIRNSAGGSPFAFNGIYWCDGAVLKIHYYGGLDGTSLQTETITNVNSYTPTSL